MLLTQCEHRKLPNAQSMGNVFLSIFNFYPPKFLQCTEITFATRILKSCFMKREVEHKNIEISL